GGPTPRMELDTVAMVTVPEGHFAIRATLLETSQPADLEAAIRQTPSPCLSPTYGRLGDRSDRVVIRCSDPSGDGAFRPLVVFDVPPDGWVDRLETQIETTDPTDSAARTEGVLYAEAAMATLQPEDAAPAVERGTIELGRACEASGTGDALTMQM